jgi:hypothetical protein
MEERKSRWNPTNLFGILLVLGAVYLTNFAQRTGELCDLREDLGRSKVRLEELKEGTSYLGRLPYHLKQYPKSVIPLRYGTVFMQDNKPMFGGSIGSAPLDTIVSNKNKEISYDEKTLEELRDKIRNTKRKAIWFF